MIGNALLSGVNGYAGSF